MNRRAGPKATLGCLTVTAAIMVVTAYITTATFNPIAVFTSKSIVGMVVISVSGLLLGAALLQSLMLGFYRLSIRLVSGKDPDDLICMGCGHSLMAFMGSHGLPRPCPRCRTWWHSGPACYAKDLDRPGPLSSFPCPTCRRRESQSLDYLNNVDDLFNT